MSGQLPLIGTDPVELGGICFGLPAPGEGQEPQLANWALQRYFLREGREQFGPHLFPNQGRGMQNHPTTVEQEAAEPCDTLRLTQCGDGGRPPIAWS